MAILNFQKQFADAIKDGSKCQTIRKRRKYPIKKGDTLYLYTGLRTKNAEKLKEIKCSDVLKVKMDWKKVALPAIVINYLEYLDEFAIADGFEDWTEMINWFESVHGIPFEGDIIMW